MYRLLKMQTRKNKIPAQMPSDVKVANKTGELDNVENDAGIIYDTAKGIDCHSSDSGFCQRKQDPYDKFQIAAAVKLCRFVQ